MLDIHTPILVAADAAAEGNDRAACLSQLRKLGLDDFGLVLFTLPLKKYPNLTRVLPRMVPEDIQRSWTGAAGHVLLNQSLGITRILETVFWRNRGRSLSAAKILDFGCGYGRLIRLMYFYQDPSLTFACDPWDKSVEICRVAGLTENVALTDYLPEDLPYADQTFDFVYAFSVFTHLSERAARTSLTALRRKIKDDGVLVITIRPIEYWPFAIQRRFVSDTEVSRKQHIEHGFGFSPHNREPIDGDVTYGDTTIAPEYLVQNFPEWRVVSIERQLSDNLQLFVTMLPN